MEVRCPRCGTRQALAERPAPGEVRRAACVECGAVFGVRGKAAEKAPLWAARSPGGGPAIPFDGLAALHQGIANGAVALEDDISRNGNPWRPIRDVPELVALFELADDALAIPPLPPSAGDTDGQATQADAGADEAFAWDDAEPEAALPPMLPDLGASPRSAPDSFRAVRDAEVLGDEDVGIQTLQDVRLDLGPAPSWAVGDALDDEEPAIQLDDEPTQVVQGHSRPWEDEADGGVVAHAGLAASGGGTSADGEAPDRAQGGDVLHPIEPAPDTGPSRPTADPAAAERAPSTAPTLRSAPVSQGVGGIDLPEPGNATQVFRLPVPSGPAFPDDEDPREGRGFRWAGGLLVLAALGAGGWWGYGYYQRSQQWRDEAEAARRAQIERGPAAAEAPPPPIVHRPVPLPADDEVFADNRLRPRPGSRPGTTATSQPRRDRELASAPATSEDGPGARKPGETSAPHAGDPAVLSAPAKKTDAAAPTVGKDAAATEMKAAEKKAAEKKATEKKAAEEKAAEKAAAEKKAAEKKAAEKKAAEKKAAPGTKAVSAITAADKKAAAAKAAADKKAAAAKAAADKKAAKAVPEKEGADAFDSLMSQAGKLLSKNPGRALELLQRAARLSPGNVAPVYKMGMAYLYKGDSTNAILAFLRAKRMSPRHRPTFLGLARAYERAGRKADAISVYKQFLTICASCRQAKTVRANLQRLGVTAP